jgi:methionyl-tRNA formyltransferase
LAAGDTETGVAVQQMEPTLDTGPLHEVVRLPIAPTDTSGSLHEKLAVLGAEATLRAIAALGERAPVPQASEGVTYAAKVEKEEGLVSLSAPAAAIERQLRAFDPGPGAYLAQPAGPLKLRRVTVVEGRGAPGEVLSLKPLVVATGQGALRLDRVQAAGRKEVEGHEYANGARLRVGDRLA